MDKNINNQIELQHIKKPSKLVIWSILPVLGIWISTIFISVELYLYATLIMTLIAVGYVILVAQHIWQTNYSGHVIVIESSLSSLKLIIDHVVVDQYHSLLRRNVELSAKIDEQQIRVLISFAFRAECELFVD